jgi:hypothetical protein
MNAGVEYLSACEIAVTDDDASLLPASISRTD